MLPDSAFDKCDFSTPRREGKSFRSSAEGQITIISKFSADSFLFIIVRDREYTLQTILDSASRLFGYARLQRINRIMRKVQRKTQTLDADLPDGFGPDELKVRANSARVSGRTRITADNSRMEIWQVCRLRPSGQGSCECMRGSSGQDATQ